MLSSVRRKVDANRLLGEPSGALTDPLRSDLSFLRLPDLAGGKVDLVMLRDDLFPVLAVVWLSSIARVAVAVVCHETFETEATLALLSIVVLPLMLAPPVVWSFRRRPGADAAEDRAATSETNATVVSLVPRLASRRRHA